MLEVIGTYVINYNGMFGIRDGFAHHHESAGAVPKAHAADRKDSSSYSG